PERQRHASARASTSEPVEQVPVPRSMMWTAVQCSSFVGATASEEATAISATRAADGNVSELSVLSAPGGREGAVVRELFSLEALLLDGQAAVPQSVVFGIDLREGDGDARLD